MLDALLSLLETETLFFSPLVSLDVGVLEGIEHQSKKQC